jgi:hypothetical protein
MTQDILSFNAVKDSEQGFPLQMKNADGTDVNITFFVLGRHADVVQKFSTKTFRKLQAEEAMAKKTGKDKIIDIDELREQNLESACIRVTGWEGVKQEFDVAILRTALKNNPHWQDQIFEASNEDANFMKAS